MVGVNDINRHLAEMNTINQSEAENLVTVIVSNELFKPQRSGRFSMVFFSVFEEIRGNLRKFPLIIVLMLQWRIRVR